MKKISLLVSTVDLNLKGNKSFAEHIDFSICEVIIVQQRIHLDEVLELDFEAKIISVEEKGLAKSRNKAWAAATCPIALICDDDIQFVQGFEQRILSAYEQYPDAALISYQIKDEKGRPYKDYNLDGGRHTFRSVLRVNSVELSVCLDKFSIQSPFDEQFGLGATCPTGEDTIFVMDTFKSGLPCYYMAEPLVIHPLESSGKAFDQSYPFHRGQVYARAFGGIGLFFGLFFAIKKHPLYKEKLGLLDFVRSFIRGFFTDPA